MNEELRYLSDEEIIGIMKKFISNITPDDLEQPVYKDRAIDKNFWNLG